MTVNWSDLAREAGFYDKKGPPSIVKKVVPRKDAKKAKPEIVKFAEDMGRMWVGNTEFRRTLSYPDYYISKKGYVKNIDGQTLRREVTSSDSQVSLRVGIKNKNVYKWKLIFEAWPEMAPKFNELGFIWNSEEWRYLQEWPGYAVSRSGNVVRLKNWTLLTINKGRVFMSKGEKQQSRSVRRLVLEEFGVVLS